MKKVKGSQTIGSTFLLSLIKVAMTIGSLSTPVFEMRTATGSEYFACQDSGLSQIFKLRASNSAKVLSDINVVV